MKYIYKLICILSFVFIATISNSENLYYVSSKDMGIVKFDATVTEIERKPRSSLIEIPNFNNRSAAASRWMMCAYTDLAVKRGFNYWAAFYPEKNDNLLLIVFPNSESKNEQIYKDLSIDSEKPIIASVEKYARFCGIEIK